MGNWDFTAQVSSFGYDITTSLSKCELSRHSSVRIEGTVTFASPIKGGASVEGTSVYADFWAGDDAKVRKLQAEGLLGNARISKDAATITDISTDLDRALAGIQVSVALTKTQFDEMRADFAVVDPSALSLSFDCTGEQVVAGPSKFSKPELMIDAEFVDLCVTSYRIGSALLRPPGQ